MFSITKRKGLKNVQPSFFGAKFGKTEATWLRSASAADLLAASRDMEVWTPARRTSCSVYLANRNGESTNGRMAKGPCVSLSASDSKKAQVVLSLVLGLFGGSSPDLDTWLISISY